MSPQSNSRRIAGISHFAGMLMLTGALCLAPLHVYAQATSKAAKPTVAAKLFDTATQAADALISAADNFDVAAFEQILGQDGKDIVITGEPVRDKEVAAKFAALARQKKSVEVDAKNPKKATLVVGPEDWPLPIPIVKVGKKWAFDAKAGREEILFERIGENELTAIELCRGYVDAQHEYALTKHDGSSVNQYAQRITSSPGKQDGLAWKNPDGTWGGPVGEEIAQVIEQGYSAGEPFHGYYFKVLKGQGPDAPLGQMDFVIKGVMIGGFALIAAPAQYGVTGVKTFMVSHDGVVYEKDLGPDTLEVAKKMELFNPDKSWHPVGQ